MVRRLGLGKNNHLTYASLALNPRHMFSCRNKKKIFTWYSCLSRAMHYTVQLYLLWFQHFSESCFLLGTLHRRNKFANFCHDLMQNHLSKLPMQKKFYSSQWFLKKSNSFTFSHSKNECTVTWRQIFNKFCLFNCSEIFTILLETSIIQIQQRKVKSILLDKN